MIKHKIRYLLPIILLLIIVTGCSNKKSIKKYNKKMKDSMETVETVNSKIEMFDLDIKIYEYRQVSTISGDKITVNVEEFALDDTFTLNSIASNETIENLDRDALLPLDLKKKLIKTYEVDGDLVICKVSSHDFPKIYNIEDLNSQGEVTLQLLFAEGKIISINCSFTTTSGRDVNIQTEYSY